MVGSESIPVATIHTWLGLIEGLINTYRTPEATDQWADKLSP